MLRRVIDFIFWKKALARRDRILNFQIAIFKNNVDLVKHFLAEGLSPNQPFHHNGERPLHTAAAYGGEAMIDCLISAGADPLVGIQLQASLLSPSGYARLRQKPENETYLKRIEETERKRRVETGQNIPVFSDKVELFCQRSRRQLQCPPPRKLSPN